VPAMGVLLGFAVPAVAPTEYFCPDWAHQASMILGWTYFLAWSVSFYPQAVLNWERRSVVGLSLDFTALNVVGFACYSVFNVGMYFWPAVREQYAQRHDGAMPLVRPNDVFFSLHALVLCAIVGLQAIMYPRGSQRLSWLSRGMLGACALMVPVGVVLAAAHACAACTWLDLLTSLSYFKLAISITKYVPQVVLNAKRRSTVGWNIDNVVLDFVGGMLSLAQAVLDAGCSGDWSAIAGNPVKFGLGFSSMVFDTVFLIQHYVLYPNRRSSVALSPH